MSRIKGRQGSAMAYPRGFSAEVVKQGFGGGRLSTYTIALEAWRRGLTVTFSDGALRRFQISDGARAIAMDYARPSSLTKPRDWRKVHRKSDAKRLLEAVGVPVPVGALIKTEETNLGCLRAHAESIGYPLVIKPNEGSVGKGVLVGIDSWDRLRDGYRYLVEELGAHSVLMEQHYEGDDFRVLVIGNEAVAACQRIPANVEGDGISTVSELIRKKKMLLGGTIPSSARG